jgi:hypothetical protein
MRAFVAVSLGLVMACLAVSSGEGREPMKTQGGSDAAHKVRVARLRPASDSDMALAEV